MGSTGLRHQGSRNLENILSSYGMFCVAQMENWRYICKQKLKPEVSLHLSLTHGNWEVAALLTDCQTIFWLWIVLKNWSVFPGLTIMIVIELSEWYCESKYLLVSISYLSQRKIVCENICNSCKAWRQIISNIYGFIFRRENWSCFIRTFT